MYTRSVPVKCFNPAFQELYQVKTYMYEFYFDSPIAVNTLSDTIYISCDMGFDVVEMGRQGLIDYQNYAFYTSFCSPTGIYDQSYPLPQSLDPIGLTYVDDMFGPLFPIINLRCDEPQLRLVELGDGTATVEWKQYDLPEAYQLAIGDPILPPDSNTIISPAPTDSVYTFDGLTNGVRYMVWVRKACRHITPGYDTLVWSSWSLPAGFYATSSDTTGVGIGTRTDGQYFTLSPNPARNRVVVELPSAETGGRLSLHDLAGRELEASVMAGPTHTLDLSPFPAGIYLVKLVTPRGVSTRRLVIDK